MLYAHCSEEGDWDQNSTHCQWIMSSTKKLQWLNDIQEFSTKYPHVSDVKKAKNSMK